MTKKTPKPSKTTIDGYIICDNGYPTREIDISQDITGGTTIASGFVFFEDRDDADQAVKSLYGLIDQRRTVHAATLTIGEEQETDWKDSEDEDE